MDDGDVISRLPADLLVSILSRLTLKEALVTSVLSRRWEKLWTFYQGNMDFEVSQALRQKGCSNYVRLVNKVLDKLEAVEGGGVLDSFTIPFDLCRDNLSSVDRWVQFALEKRTVKRLDFDPRKYSCESGCLHDSETYDFPPLQCFNSQQHNIRALTSISFDHVNVSGKIVEHFLSNCPLLQSLDLIRSCKPLIHLRVSGETLALKHLVVRRCPDLATVEIYAPNLVSLNYFSCEITNVKFDVQNTPKLVDFSFGALKPPSTALAFRLLTCFSYIQKLELHICSEEPEGLLKLTEMTSVKHLTMTFLVHYSESIHTWTPLLKAFPLLQKFTVDMRYRWEWPWRPNEMPRDKVYSDKFPNKCLKELEFVSYDSLSDNDIELFKHLLKNMATLEKFLLRCHYYYRAESIAAKLEKIIPKKVRLVIL